MMAGSTQHSVSKLQDELLVHPIILSIGSLGLSSLMSRSIYATIDWKPIVICVCGDILAIGVDHYFDHADALVCAQKTKDREVESVFLYARILLFCSAAILLVALCLSPLATWAPVAICLTPVLLWDIPILSGGRSAQLHSDETSQQRAYNPLTIKRIPGMKAIFVGIIRGCGTFAVVHSVLCRSSHLSVRPGSWSPQQTVIWSIVNRACHAVMADVRDFHEDTEQQVPTIPVLLRSTHKAKSLLSAIHILTMWAYADNFYIIFASLYALILVWILDENSPRALYRLSFHSQTLVAIMYATIELSRDYYIAAT